MSAAEKKEIELSPERFGDYLLIERISTGGMAEVYLAKTWDGAELPSVVAIKRILPIVAEDPDFQTMFADEGKISVQLEHEHIGRVFEFGKIDDEFFIAMEYISGQDVRSITSRLSSEAQSFPPRLALEISAAICRGLDYAHNKEGPDRRALKIIHRDVSPPNVLIGYDGSVRLIDFGIAKAASRLTRTRAGKLKGKFSYMSPEQASGKSFDHRSDIFACGTLLYEMLTLQRPFVGKNQLDVLHAIRKAETVAPSQHNPGLPKEVDEILDKALTKDPKDRYQHASDMADAIDALLAKDLVEQPKESMVDWLAELFSEELAREHQRDAQIADLRPEDFVQPSREERRRNPIEYKTERDIGTNEQTHPAISGQLDTGQFSPRQRGDTDETTGQFTDTDIKLPPEEQTTTRAIAQPADKARSEIPSDTVRFELEDEADAREQQRIRDTRPTTPFLRGQKPAIVAQDTLDERTVSEPPTTRQAIPGGAQADDALDATIDERSSADEPQDAESTDPRAEGQTKDTDPAVKRAETQHTDPALPADAAQQTDPAVKRAETQQTDPEVKRAETQQTDPEVKRADVPHPMDPASAQQTDPAVKRAEAAQPVDDDARVDDEHAPIPTGAESSDDVTAGQITSGAVLRATAVQAEKKHTTGDAAPPSDLDHKRPASAQATEIVADTVIARAAPPAVGGPVTRVRAALARWPSTHVVLLSALLSLAVVGIIVIVVVTAGNKRAPAPSYGRLLISTQRPVTCSVFVDKKPVGLLQPRGTMKLEQIGAGSHQVRLQCHGYASHIADVTVKAGEVAVVDATLVKQR